MELLRCLWPITFLACWVTTSPVPDMQSMQEPAKSNHRHIGSRTLDNVNLDDNGVGKSISDIAAQLLDEEPEISMDEGNTNTENQAKVVDHIKGLLSDIVTNTIVDDGEDKDMYIVDMKSEDTLNNTPTILQTVFNLDSNTIKDKESFIKVINAMKKREKETTQTVDTTTYISVFENNQKKNAEKDLVKSGSMEKQSILDQYIEVYDVANDDNEDTSTSLVLKSADTTTTASTTSSTTTSSTTTSSTTTSTSTTPTTTASTTTTTQEPTLIERAGNIVTGGIGGIFNGFANIGQAINQATSNFWIPIQLGRKKRGIEDIADVVKSQITSKDVFMNFLLFQKRIKAMNPEKLNEIVKGVVKEVINTDADEQIGEFESFYDDLIAGQVTDLLLRPRPYSKQRAASTIYLNEVDTQKHSRSKTTHKIEAASPTLEHKQNTMNTTQFTTLSTTTQTTTTIPTTTTTQDSLIVSLLRDQGPQTLGVSLASLAYTVVAAMPYWLPAVAGRRRRRRNVESELEFDQLAFRL